MTKIHAQVLGNQVLLPRQEWDHLVSLARQVEEVDVLTQEEELPTVGLMRLAEQSKAFAWLAEEEDLYSADDLKVRYR